MNKISMESFEQEREKNSNNKHMVDATISTWVPSKWRFVDLETGDVWTIDNEGKFHKDKNVAWNYDVRGTHLIWEDE